ncbi:hypothetical protein TL16_g11648 [Triparma laevis f. inornata]|uniref:Uncharacterized protein n=2 Tax=Triparma laevis TaxID=1534972 RepID=A0A9W7DUH9_9STRA|nr:hypothetical protein TrLO_g734 [Triparma laevis f. longispina]GMH90046.1 hypothetical protein TL16_g11648 [Triparma laevis f. inornata]
MSKYLASKYNEGNESRKMGGKMGLGDEGDEEGVGILEVSSAESLPISTTVSTFPATTDQFMHTPEFRRHFVEFVPGDTLMALRVATKGWKAAADVFIDDGVRSGEIIVHDGKNISHDDAEAREKRCELVTRVIFLLNITKVGEQACRYAANLVVVDIPEGVENIEVCAFCRCSSLTTISFPTTLKSIGNFAFADCSRLDNVDLLHTNLQELSGWAFECCSELKSMTIPDSLQRLGVGIFYLCFKLTPSNIIVNDLMIDTTSEVIAHLRAQQSNP